MRLKILHVLDHSVPLHSGYTFRTLSILREQRKLGWDTLQLTTPKQGGPAVREETVEGFRFLRTPGAPADSPWRQMRATAARLREAADEFEPDIIHAHSPVLTGLPALFVARRKRLPLVYEMRAAWEDAAVDHGTTRAGSLRYKITRLAESFVLRRASHVTAICEGLRREIASRGIDEEKITLIPNAVDVERFAYRDGAAGGSRGDLGLGEGPILGFIGSFYGYEGLDLLLEAVARMAADGTAVGAVLVGGGPEEARLRALATSLGIESRVRFMGRVGHDEVQKYYSAIDILVYARKRTRLTELVTPLKPLEAMAQGNVFVASDVGGHKELIRDGETGVLFEAGSVAALAESLHALWRDRENWGAMRERARDHVRTERNWTRSVSGYRPAYKRALAERGRTVAALEC
jgi:hypothetical protein